MAWTTPHDVILRWDGAGAPSEDSESLLTAISDIEDAALFEFPDIQARIDSNVLPLTRVKKVVSYAVIRLLKTGQDYRASYSESTGPFSQSASYDSGLRKGAYLTADELAQLAPASTKAFTINTAPNSHAHEADYFYPWGPEKAWGIY